MAAIFADEIFKHIFLNENILILIQISLNFVPKIQHLAIRYCLNLSTKNHDQSSSMSLQTTFDLMLLFRDFFLVKWVQSISSAYPV